MNPFKVTSIALLLLTGSVYAMPPMGGPCQGPDTEQLQKLLALTDEQTISLEALLDEQYEVRRLLHEQHRSEMEQHRLETRDRLSTLLSDEQLEKLDLLQEWRETRREPRW